MRYPYALLLGFGSFLLQSTVMNHFKLFGTSPNLVLCSVLFLSFLYEGYYGILVGLVFGLIQDLSFSPLIGPSSIAYMLVALFLTGIRHFLYRDSVLNLVIASAAGTVAYYGIAFAIFAIFGGTYHITAVLMKLPVLLGYHFLVMVVLYQLMGRRSIRHPEDRYYKGNRMYYR